MKTLCFYQGLFRVGKGNLGGRILNKQKGTLILNRDGSEEKCNGRDF